MKLVFIGGRSIHMLGGIENYMLNLTTHLAKQGHECVVWCESDHNAVEQFGGVKIIYQRGSKNNLICKPLCGLKATVKTLLREKNVSIIHYNAWPPSLWCWIPRMFGIPSLMEGHGLEWQRRKYGVFAKKIMKLMERITAHMNQHLIMCSEEQVKFFHDEYGVDAVCIPGAVNLPKLNETNSSSVLETFALEPRKYFLFMGRLVQEKNPDYLIRAFNNIGQNEYKLLIAGNNASMPKYVKELRALAVDNPRIIFTGAVYGDDKDMLLRNAYCFCLPSTIEGLSIAMLEAASYRLPIIASNIDANKEFLGDDAIYVRPENTEDLSNAMDLALSDPDGIKKSAEKNYCKVVSQYTWDSVAEHYVSYLHSIGVK